MSVSRDRRFTQTRQRLIDATVDLIDRVGWDSVTLKAVARECGISAPASYKHFPNKAALFEAAAMEVSTRLADSCEPFVDADPRVSLIGIGAFVLRFASEHPRLWEFATFDGDNPAEPENVRIAESAGSAKTRRDSNARSNPSPAASTRSGSLAPCWMEVTHPFLRLMRTETTRLTAAQGHPGEAANRLFVAMWSFVQGYSTLIAHGAVVFDDGFFQAALSALMTINERI